MRERNQRNWLPSRHGVRLARHVPVAVRRVEVAPLLASEVQLGVRAGAAMVHLVRENVLLEILGGIEHRPGFEQRDVEAADRSGP